MKSTITMAIAIITLILVGCTDMSQTNDSTPFVMENVIIEEIDSGRLFIKAGHENQDIWVSINEDTNITDNFDNTVDPTTFEVGDVITIYFNVILESSPLQTTALQIEIG